MIKVLAKEINKKIYFLDNSSFTSWAIKKRLYCINLYSNNLNIFVNKNQK